MVSNNFPIWIGRNFSVRPEHVEGWTEKFQVYRVKPIMLRQAQHERLDDRK